MPVNTDPFNADAVLESEADEVTEVPSEEPEVKETPAEETVESEETESGEESKTSETPLEEKGEEVTTSTKMIPEHRFKAAMNAVTEELKIANQKLAKYEAAPVPDKDEDPEGFNLHIRMEASKIIMRELMSDYDEVLTHYKSMAEANPYLNQAVAAHPAPAKYAYDLAKESMKVAEARNLVNSEEWKEFQEFKKSKAAKGVDLAGAKVSKQVTESLTAKVPNLNRVTNTQPVKIVHSDEDDLFKGAL